MGTRWLLRLGALDPRPFVFEPLSLWVLQALLLDAAGDCYDSGLAPGKHHPPAPSPRTATFHSPCTAGPWVVGEDQAIQHKVAQLRAGGAGGYCLGFRPCLGLKSAATPSLVPRWLQLKVWGKSWGAATPVNHRALQRTQLLLIRRGSSLSQSLSQPLCPCPFWGGRAAAAHRAGVWDPSPGTFHLGFSFPSPQM